MWPSTIFFISHSPPPSLCGWRRFKWMLKSMKNVHVILYDRWKDKKKRWHPLRSTFSTTSWDSFRLSHRQGYGTENSSFFRPATAKPICSEEVWVFNSFPQWTTSGSSTVLTSLPHLPARALCSHLFECPQHPTDLTPLDSFIAKCWRTYKLLDNLAMPWTSLPEGATTRAFPIHIAREGGYDEWQKNRQQSHPHYSCFCFSRWRQRWVILLHPLILTCDNFCAFYGNKLKCPRLSFWKISRF